MHFQTDNRPLILIEEDHEADSHTGIAYYVILPRQGVWGLPEAPSGVQGQSPVGGFGVQIPP